MLNRRDSLKLSGAAALTLLAGEGSAASTDDVAGEKIKAAGYSYDRIQAIKDGTVAMDEYEDTVKLMGAGYWRYGIESNRKELELVMRYTYEQGLVKKQVDFEQLFHPSVLDT